MVTRTYEELTNSSPTVNELYDTNDDYRYLEDKINVLSDVSKLKTN